MAVVTFLKDSVFADEYAAKNGFLQRRDPRIKVLSILVLIFLTVLTKRIEVLLCLYLFCLVLAGSSEIKLVLFLKRTWIFIPLFSLFIAIPAMFSVFTPGAVLARFRIYGLSLAVTKQGFEGAEMFVMRVLTSVSYVVLLAITTRHNELLKVLRIFKIPHIFVMTIGMCYRYIYLFAEIVEHTYTAIKSRVGLGMHHRKGREIVTWSIANLWLRAYDMNNQVYNAMLSRGYTGEPRVLNEFRSAPADWAWMGFIGAISGLTIFINYFMA